MTASRQLVGNLGEQAATRLLHESGYEILHRNYRVRGGELDIVAMHGGTLVFCEVKTRTSLAFGLPEESVTPTKRKRIRHLAMEYLQRETPRAAKIRFDVMAVTAVAGRVSEIRHIRDAF